MRQRRLPKFLQGKTDNVSSVNPLFQDGRIDTLAELQDISSSRNIYLVGLDVEGHEGVSNGVNSIGVAACAAPCTKSLCDGGPSQTKEPVDLSDIIKRHGVEAHVLACATRRPKAKFEGFPFGEVCRVEKGDVEVHLVNRLNAMLCRNQTAMQAAQSGQAAEMVLVTWGWQSEFYAMTTSFPRVARHFSRWIDVSDIILATMAAGSKQPSLRDTMLSMGFIKRHVQSPWKQNHSPGMDAARVLGTLIQLWSNPAGWEILPVRKQERERRRIWSQKPPLSTFPWMVRITIKQKNPGEIPFLPDELKFGERLFKFLKSNVVAPLAVGVCERQIRSVHGSTKKGNVAYACFANADAVALFLEWDGREIGGKTLILENISLASDNTAQAAGSLLVAAGTHTSTS
ncbi:hypothetical protein DHEL01_v211780 [Diaporthe helianthi]|uniref:Uncharacterized protein n=1 Tax=Diaporthe helianthi TaxID=158607 RepID=A0A2P5HHV5_DIAHE|nr:hypothetical protein DHEL01_v211780 [Diaporthe helianthi]